MKVKFKEIPAHWGHCVCEIFHSLYTTAELYSIEKNFSSWKNKFTLFLSSSQVPKYKYLHHWCCIYHCFHMGNFFKSQKYKKINAITIYLLSQCTSLLCLLCISYIYPNSPLKTIKIDCNRYNGWQKEETNITWKLLHRQKRSGCNLFAFVSWSQVRVALPMRETLPDFPHTVGVHL